MTILIEGEQVTLDDLPEKLHAPLKPPSMQSIEIPAQGISLNDTIEEFENELILKAMKKCNGVKSKAAKLLMLNRTTLVEKIKKKKLNGWNNSEDD
jgi:DNA-binding NtrC family response regulator